MRGVERQSVLVCIERLLGATERVQRDAAVDDRLGVVRIDLQRAVVRLEGILVAPHIVHQHAAPHPGIRREGVRLEQPIDHTQRRFELAALEIVGSDLLERIRVEVRTVVVRFVRGYEIRKPLLVGEVFLFVESEVKHACSLGTDYTLAGLEKTDFPASVAAAASGWVARGVKSTY